jgi:hypothetical protein
VTIEKNTEDKLQVKAGGIGTTQLADGAVTTDKLADGFTYLVDSDAALAAWVRATPGNDYTFVKIAPGSWSSVLGVNMVASATKKVVGMNNSILNFTRGGLYYETVPIDPDYYMENVTIVCTGSTYPLLEPIAFTKCINLTNCSGSVYINDFTSIAFNKCINLTNCSASGAGSPGRGFSECTALSYCTGSASTVGTMPMNSYAFVECTGMRFNRSLTQYSYSNCYVPRGGTEGSPTPAFTAGGGWNAGPDD